MVSQSRATVIRPHKDTHALTRVPDSVICTYNKTPLVPNRNKTSEFIIIQLRKVLLYPPQACKLRVKNTCLCYKITQQEFVRQFIQFHQNNEHVLRITCNSPQFFSNTRSCVNSTQNRFVKIWQWVLVAKTTSLCSNNTIFFFVFCFICVLLCLCFALLVYVGFYALTVKRIINFSKWN